MYYNYSHTSTSHTGTSHTGTDQQLSKQVTQITEAQGHTHTCKHTWCNQGQHARTCGRTSPETDSVISSYVSAAQNTRVDASVGGQWVSKHQIIPNLHGRLREASTTRIKTIPTKINHIAHTWATVDLNYISFQCICWTRDDWRRGSCIWNIESYK